MKYEKSPISFDDQTERLLHKGLIITNKEEVRKTLSNISFYRLRAYTFPFQDNTQPNHPFIGTVTWEEIIDLYTFDRKLRLVVFDAIEKIEIALRTQIIYHWSMRYGSHWHLDQALYKDGTKFIKHLSSLQKEIGRSNETFLKHYREKYSHPQDPPCWMSLEVSSIGLLSLIFRNLKNCPEKKAVIHHFGLYGTEVLENWMHNFCHIRNICAHHGRLWNRRISIPIAIPKKTKLPFIEKRAIYPYKLYSALCAIVYLMEVINPKSTFKATLVELIVQCPKGQLKEMGFPKDWKNEKFWQ